MRLLSSILALCVCVGALAQGSSGTMSLEECRSTALANNKKLMITNQRLRKADYDKRTAFAAYLPAIDFDGAYMYMQKEISILGEDKLLPIKSFNLQTQKYEFDIVKNPMTGEPIKDPATGQYIPSSVAYMPEDALKVHTHNYFFGAIRLTQPIYMGGKIVALNKITHFAEELAGAQHEAEAENVIYAVDAAYWQVVSLKSKYLLAQSYVNMLDTLDYNVKCMLEQGVATRADLLKVDVKLNEAKVDLTKVENGLTLSRMALNQVLGLPIDAQYTLQDEEKEYHPIEDTPLPLYDIQQVFQQRPDLQQLRLGIHMLDQKSKVERAAMLPTVAVIGAYSFSNPNIFHGLRNRFDGQFSVGAMVSIPLWHWGGNYYKYKAAQCDKTIMELQLQDAEELVTLQVKQASFRVQESLKTYEATQSNLQSANENLRCADLSFREGLCTSEDVMQAQTAWLKAHSECVDAMIDVHMCDTYLAKALGTLVNEQ